MDTSIDENPYMDIAEIIAANLTAWMAETPALDTLQKLEVKSGVGFGTVRRTKNGDGNVTVEKLAAIAAAFGRSPADLITPHGIVEAKSPPHRVQEPQQAYLSPEAAATRLAESASEVATLWIKLPPETREKILSKMRAAVILHTAKVTHATSEPVSTGQHDARADTTAVGMSDDLNERLNRIVGQKKSPDIKTGEGE